MTRKWIGVLVVLMLAVTTAFLPADDRTVLKAISARGVVFEKWGYKLKLTRLDSKCIVNLGSDAKNPSTYSLDIEGSCKMPDDVDGVLITERIRVLKALTVTGKDIRIPPKAGSGRSGAAYRSGTFIPILRVKEKLHVAEVQVDNLALRTNPYVIDKIEAELVVVVAVNRVEKSIPAAVSQTLVELAPGLKARVSSMRIGSKRKLSVELSCIRRAAGPQGAFIEAISALDADGKIIGQARIKDGDPLGQKGRVTASFTITGNSEPASLVATIVTESKIRKIPFEIIGIFQK